MLRKVAFGLFAITLLTSSAASAALVTFNTRASFDLAAGVLPIEGFEDGNVAANGVAPCPGSLNSATNNTCFSPGDILPGISFSAQTEPQIALGGAGFAGVPTKHIYANFFVDSMNIALTSSDAIGFDLYSQFANSTIRISVFDTADVLIGTFDVAGTTGGGFWGVINTSGGIGRLNLDSLTDQAEGFDNVAFGQQAVPEPATLALLGAGLVGLARRARRRSA